MGTDQTVATTNVVESANQSRPKEGTMSQGHSLVDSRRNHNVVRKPAEQVKAEQTKKGSAEMKSDFATKFPKVSERITRFGYEEKTEYTINETQMILGENPSWVRKMVTGYRGKDKVAQPLLKAHKDEAGVWRIATSSIELRLHETLKARQLREERFEDPTKFATYRRSSTEAAIAKVQRLAAEGLTAEESAALRALIKKLEAAEKVS